MCAGESLGGRSGRTIEILRFSPSDGIAWNPGNTITFANFDGRMIEVHDGDQVVLGEGEGREGLSGADWVPQTQWIASPVPACELENGWGVGAVGR